MPGADERIRELRRAFEAGDSTVLVELVTAMTDAGLDPLADRKLAQVWAGPFRAALEHELQGRLARRVGRVGTRSGYLAMMAESKRVWDVSGRPFVPLVDLGFRLVKSVNDKTWSKFKNDLRRRFDKLVVKLAKADVGDRDDFKAQFFGDIESADHVSSVSQEVGGDEYRAVSEAAEAYDSLKFGWEYWTQASGVVLPEQIGTAIEISFSSPEPEEPSDPEPVTATYVHEIRVGEGGFSIRQERRLEDPNGAGGTFLTDIRYYARGPEPLPVELLLAMLEPVEPGAAKRGRKAKA